MRVSLTQSVEEHTVMNSAAYSAPVAKFLSYGECKPIRAENWPNYPVELGLTLADVPELIRMALDLSLLEEDGLEVWASIHAWRSLGQLRAKEAIQPLMQLFGDIDNEWALIELPKVYGLIGPQAIPALSEYLTDSGNETWARVAAADSISKIAGAYPEHRDACVSAITGELGNFAENEETLNSLLICHLIELKVVEAAPLIEQVYAGGGVDESMPGTWPAVQVELGLKKKEDFTKEELQHKISPEMEKLGMILDILERQAHQSKGFGGAVPTKNKQGKKKKKKH
jgi:hypothetical protein